LFPVVGIDDDFNLYAYVGNDPLNVSDPAGANKLSTLEQALAKGLVIRNASLAGKIHAATGIAFSAKGFPIFDKIATKTVFIEGGFSGTKADFALANAKSELGKTPAGYTWHHHVDLHTMQLVPSDVHAAVGHTGGSAILRAVRDVASDPSTWVSLVSGELGLLLTSGDLSPCQDRGCEYQGSYSEGAGPAAATHTQSASGGGGDSGGGGAASFSINGTLVTGQRACDSRLRC